MAFTVYNRPLHLTDPDGRCPACLGALIGGAVQGGSNLGAQLYQNGGRLSDVSWGEVGANVAGGAVTGGLAGLTMGGTLLLDVAVGATSTAAGGVVTRAIEQTSVPGMADVEPFSGDAIATDLAFGALGGWAGHRAADLINLPEPGPRPRPGRNFRARTAKYSARLASRQTRVRQQYYLSTAVSMGFTSAFPALTDAFSGALDWLTSIGSDAPPPPPEPEQQFGSDSTIYFCMQEGDPGCPANPDEP